MADPAGGAPPKKAATAKGKGQATCPRCQRQAAGLLRIDPGMRLRLQEAGVGSGTPPQICQNCFAELTSQVSQGAKLRAHKVAEQQNKLILWKTRLNHVKEGRKEHDANALASAAVSLERYIRIVEVASEAPPNGLLPEQFKHPAKAKELPVLIAVMWDLFRIYDSMPRMSERQRQIGFKIAEFAKVTPGGGGVLRQMSKFARISKNKEVVRASLKMANFRDASCFIATVAFGENSPEVRILRDYRDEVLENSRAGKIFVKAYYAISPGISDWLRDQKQPLKFVQWTLSRVIVPAAQRKLLQFEGSAWKPKSRRSKP